MFTTIISTRHGTCKRCGLSFDAGTRIRYGGYGRTYHLSAECSKGRRQGTQSVTGHAPDIDRMVEDYAAYVMREV